MAGTVLALLAGQRLAECGTIYSYEAGVAGGGTNAQAPGQEVTTPSGGPWNNIVFDFYDGNGNPAALGTVYLLSQPYTGTASALTSSTPGFIAGAVGGGLGGSYTFATSVTLQSNTAYYFYDSALPESEWGFDENFSGLGTGYTGYGAANGGSSLSYAARPFTQAFLLTGTAAGTAPEPSSIALMPAALLALALVAHKRKLRGSHPVNRKNN
jgi:hypothetical protein